MKVIAMPDVRKKLVDMGGEPGAMTSEQFGAMNRADFERFGKLVRDAGVKAQ